MSSYTPCEERSRSVRWSRWAAGLAAVVLAAGTLVATGAGPAAAVVDAPPPPPPSTNGPCKYTPTRTSRRPGRCRCRPTRAARRTGAPCGSCSRPTRRHPAHAGPGQGAVHGAELPAPGPAPVLRPDDLPPADRLPDAQGAAVRRPERHRRGRPGYRYKDELPTDLPAGADRPDRGSGGSTRAACSPWRTPARTPTAASSSWSTPTRCCGPTTRSSARSAPPGWHAGPDRRRRDRADAGGPGAGRRRAGAAYRDPQGPAVLLSRPLR